MLFLIFVDYNGCRNVFGVLLLVVDNYNFGFLFDGWFVIIVG